MRPIVFLAVLLAACGLAEPDPLTKVRAQRDEIISAQIRRSVECQAHAIELSQASAAVRQSAIDACVAANTALQETEQRSLRDMDRRIAELSR